MNPYSHNQINTEDSVKNMVMDKFPYLAPTNLFRSQSQQEPAMQQTTSTERGSGETASPILINGIGRWGSAYAVVND